MEKCRGAKGRWGQRQPTYLGELTSVLEQSWPEPLQAFDPQHGENPTITLSGHVR